VELLNAALLVVGIVLIAVGYSRARGPWRRYQVMKAEQENINRYESWRGGPRDRRPTGASVMLAALRRRAQLGALVMGAGVVAVFLAFFLG
jgi:hypothetical protein